MPDCRSRLIPIEMQDQIAHHLMKAGSSWSHAELFFRALLVACHDNPERIGKLVTEADDELLKRPSKSRMNFRLVVLTKDSIKEPFERELNSLALAYA